MSASVIPESENEGEQLLENAEPETVSEEARVYDERANVPVSETTERFLRAILLKVPLDRIEELHLFSPLRQGTIETGIAVVAARVIVLDEPDTSLLELELEAGNEVYGDDAVEVDASADNTSVDDTTVDATVDATVDVSVDATVEVSVDAEIEATEDATVDATVDVESEDGDGDALAGDAAIDGAIGDVALKHAAEFIAEDDDSPYANEERVVAPESGIVAAEGVETDDVSDEIVPELADEIPVVKVPRIRHTVYTARYRLVVKGPERGRWEIDVVDEADAPLLTVETVVRGVQRRSGEETATVRYDSAQLARALRLTLPELP